MKKPLRPYLVRAYYDWFISNAATPYISVDTTHPDVRLPEKYGHSPQLTLNISPSAVKNLKFSESEMTFLASFDGQVAHIHLPMAAVLSIYDHKTGIGTVFEKEQAYEAEKAFRKKQSQSEATLRIVK